MRLAVVLFALAACGKNHPAADDAVDTDAATDACGGCPDGTFCAANNQCIMIGKCSGDADCSPGAHCDIPSATCIGGCGGQPLDLTYVPPNLMFVLDRSCSMNKVLTGTSTTKWTAAVTAIDEVLANYSTQIRWGMTMFPDITNDACAQDAIPFPLADNNATPIKTALDNSLVSTDPLFPDGPCKTNIDTGIQQAATDPGLMDATRKSYLMLISDGAQSGCTAGGGDAGTEMAIGDLHTTGNVDTFVVGFGSETDATELNKLATLGGQPLAGTTKYYQADTAAQLDLAFAAIADLVVSCDYHVDPAPPDPDQTYVFYNNSEVVPRDTTNMSGWNYDPATQTLTFYGAYCDRLKTHAVTDVDVLFGCPNPPVE